MYCKSHCLKGTEAVSTAGHHFPLNLPSFTSSLDFSAHTNLVPSAPLPSWRHESPVEPGRPGQRCRDKAESHSTLCVRLYDVTKCKHQRPFREAPGEREGGRSELEGRLFSIDFVGILRENIHFHLSADIPSAPAG